MKRGTLLAVIGLPTLLAAGLVCAAALLIFYGPSWLETAALPDLARRLGLKDLSVDIRRVGVGGADIGAIQLGADAETALSIGGVTADYSLAGLMDRHIEAITVSAPRIVCGVRNGEFFIGGIDLPAASRKPPEPAPFSLPVTFDRLTILNGRLIFLYEDAIHPIAFDAVIKAPPADAPEIRLSLRLRPRGERIAIDGRYRPGENRLFLSLAALPLSLARFRDLLPAPPDIRLSARLDMTGHLEATVSPFAIKDAAAELAYRDGVLALGDALTAPRLSAALRKTEEGFELTGGMSIRVEPSADLPVSPEAPLLLPLSVSGRFETATGKWDLRVTDGAAGKDASPLRLRSGGLAVTVAAPEILASLSGGAGSAPPAGRFQLKIPTVAARAGALTASFSGLDLSGRLRLGDAVSVSGAVSLAGGEILDTGAQVRLAGIQGNLPFQWPPPERGEAGEVAIQSIHHRYTALGGARAAVRQTATGLAVAGGHQSRVIDGLGLDFSGPVPLYGGADGPARIDLSVRRPAGAPALDLGRFHSGAKGFSADGVIEGRGHLTFGGGEAVSGGLSMDLSDGVVRNPESAIAVTGIAAAFSLPDLPSTRSAPALPLTIHRADIGDIRIGNISVAYQVEADGALFVERSRFEWAGGVVNGQPVRIRPGVEDYEMTLYGHRLALAEILKQFGAASAEGGGTLNGRIPVRYRNGRFLFDDGFLYSTPGDGGTLHVQGMDSLAAGIPQGSAGYTQVELAKAALKAYDYKWAKLIFNTVGDDLVVRMQFDGKPTEPLPFEYSRETGQFFRVESGPGSVFQGIRLDVNFRLPLDKLLKYKDLLNMTQ